MDNRLYSLLIGMVIILSILPIVSADVSINPFADKKSVEMKVTNDMSAFIKEDFNSDYGVIRLSKTFLWFKSGKIAEYSLTSNTESCLIDCSAYGKAVLYQNGQLFDDTTFKDRLGENVDVDTQYYIKKTESYVQETPVYEQTCENVAGKSVPQCTNTLVDTKHETKSREFWSEYHDEVLQAGDYEWKIEAKKDPSQTVDFIPIKAEKELSEWAWWNGAWLFKKSINISERAGLYNLTNYTLVFTVTYNTGMKSDFSDIRFTTSDEGTELPYWRKSFTALTSAVFYVRTSENIAINTNSSQIFMYFGNSGASTTSNVATAFLFYDGFSTDTISNYYFSGGSQSVSGGNLAFTGGGNNNGQSKIFNTTLRGMEVEMNYSTSSPNYHWGTAMHNASRQENDWYAGAFGHWAGDGARCDLITSLTTSAPDGDQSCPSAVNDAFWHYDTLQVFWKNTATLSNWTGWIDGTQRVSIETSSSGDDFGDMNALSPKTVAMQSSTNLVIDFIRARQFVNPEPTVTFGVDQAVNSQLVILNAPLNNLHSNNLNVTFNCSATDETGVLNLTLVLGGVDNHTVFGGVGQNLSLQITRTFATDTEMNWTCRSSDGTGANDPVTAVNRTFHLHTGVPQFFFTNLGNVSTLSLPINYTFNATTTDPFLDTCRYFTSDNFTLQTYPCNVPQNISFLTGGVKNITVTANDTFGNFAQLLYLFNIYDFNVTQSGSASAGEGTSSTFTLSINSTSFPITSADANLWYNGVNRGEGIKTVVNANVIQFSNTFVIPSGTGNATGGIVQWYWNYNATELTTRNTTTQSQTVLNISITDCAVTTGRVILNMTLRDEELNTLVNLTAPNTALTEINLQITSRENTSQVYSFSKVWNNNNTVAVCVPFGLLNSSSYRIDFTVGFEATGHVHEFYYMDNGTLDNTNNFNSYTDNTIDLMDLLTVDSTTFLFTFTDENGLEVPNAIIHTFRNYIGEGLFREVERSKDDTNGETHVHLVEEDVIYYFMVTQYGNIIYSSPTFNAKCLSTPCSITLSASPSETNFSDIFNEGGQYVITTDKDTRTVTLTFSLNSSSLVNLSIYSYNGDNATFIVGGSLTAMAGSIDVVVPLAYGNNTFFAVIYRDNSFIKSVWIDLTDRGQDIFGTFGGILAGILVLAVMLMAVTEGAGFIVFTVLALAVVSIMKLVDLDWMALVSIICAGAIIVWKLINRRNKPN